MSQDNPSSDSFTVSVTGSSAVLAPPVPGTTILPNSALTTKTPGGGSWDLSQWAAVVKAWQGAEPGRWQNFTTFYICGNKSCTVTNPLKLSQHSLGGVPPGHKGTDLSLTEEWVNWQLTALFAHPNFMVTTVYMN